MCVLRSGDYKYAIFKPVHLLDIRILVSYILNSRPFRFYCFAVNLNSETRSHRQWNWKQMFRFVCVCMQHWRTRYLCEKKKLAIPTIVDIASTHTHTYTYTQNLPLSRLRNGWQFKKQKSNRSLCTSHVRLDYIVRTKTKYVEKQTYMHTRRRIEAVMYVYTFVCIGVHVFVLFGVKSYAHW